MSRALSTILMSVALAAIWPSTVAAQTMPSCKTWSITPTPHEIDPPPGSATDAPRRLFAKADSGSFVELTCDSAQLFAEEVELDRAGDILRARGQVAFIDGAQRITAERLEFNTRTKLGSFWNAQGIMEVSGKANPQSILGTTEADAYFFAERIDKIGVDRYRMTNGRLTTCVQATPRWEFESSSVVMVRDRHAVMRNAVLRIKDVPVLYLPWMYYPINKDNRATGFLMPSWGSSALRGQMFSSAFFWAINRSQDATVRYDFSSGLGKGYGLEYRYVGAPGSFGSISGSMLTGKSGTPGALITSKVYSVSGDLVQQLPLRLILRGTTNYTNSMFTQQVTQTSLYLSTLSYRSANANLRGSYGRVVADAEAGITDTFYSPTSGTRTGSAPRIGATFASSPIGRSQLYFGSTAEFFAIRRQYVIGDPKTKANVNRIDFNPTMRLPVSRLAFLNLTLSGGFRFTRWDKQTSGAALVSTPLQRQLFDLRADVRGPTVVRIFNTPGSKYATRWKHLVEPTFSITKNTAFDKFKQVPQYDYTDLIVGGVTSMSYGLANRLLAKRPSAAGGAAIAQEIASIQVQQTYYSNALASTYDTTYTSAAYTASKWSPIAISGSVSPFKAFSNSVRIEYDGRLKGVRSIGLNSGLNTTVFTATGGWSRTSLLTQDAKTLKVTKTSIYDGLNFSASAHTVDNKLRASWAWTYDLVRKQQIQQSYTAQIMSQCCGVAAEYQVYNLGTFALNGLSQDKRFNLSFSLAGIGTFSNLLGAFGR
jgi:LPS-assembly protein